MFLYLKQLTCGHITKVHFRDSDMGLGQFNMKYCNNRDSLIYFFEDSPRLREIPHYLGNPCSLGESLYIHPTPTIHSFKLLKDSCKLSSFNEISTKGCIF